MITPRPTASAATVLVSERSAHRQRMVGGTIAVLLATMATYTGYWQVERHIDLAGRARAQSTGIVVSPSARGMIQDRHGHILALTVSGSSIILDPLEISLAEQKHPGTRLHIAQMLASTVGTSATALSPQLDGNDQYRVLTDTTGQPYYLTASVATALQHEGLPGISLADTTWRTTPDGSLASQILGFVRATDGTGQYGIEQQFNTALQGRAGTLTGTFDVAGDPLATRPEVMSTSQAGATITLTLDANLQQFVESGLRDAIKAQGADGGSVIVLDPHTGDILAMASAPGFDPAHYGQADETTFVNPAVSHLYDPGSTMKALTMAMGVDSGVITPETTLADPGYYDVGGQRIYNWNQLAWGTESMTEVLAHSANVGVAWVAVDRLGPQTFNRYLHDFGFGAPTGIALPAEAAGLLPQPTPDQTLLTLAEQSFGESIGVTPLQMVMAYGALANGGTLLRPRIVAAIGTHPTPAKQVVRQVISPDSARTITRMLIPAGQQGDARTGLITGVTVAAKTGTSVPDPAQPGLTYASVLGYAPADHPAYVILVKLDHPRTSIFGGEAAGPLWRAIVRFLMVHPSGESQEGR